MEVQQEGRVGEYRGPDRRSSPERRIGNGRRLWSSGNEVALEDEQRAAVRRVGSVRLRQALDNMGNTTMSDYDVASLIQWSGW